MLVLFKRTHRRVAWPARDHLWRAAASSAYTGLKDAATLRYQLLARRLQKLHAVQFINDVPPISLVRYLKLHLLLQNLGFINRHFSLPRVQCFYGLDPTPNVRWINDLVIVGNMVTSLLKRPFSRLAPVLSVLLKECLIVFGHRGRHGICLVLDLCELQRGRIVVSVQPLLQIPVRRIYVHRGLLTVCARFH